VLLEVGHTGILERTSGQIMGNNERKIVGIVSRHSEKSQCLIMSETVEASGISVWKVKFSCSKMYLNVIIYFEWFSLLCTGRDFSFCTT
jgi:hypothetical protein